MNTVIYRYPGKIPSRPVARPLLFGICVNQTISKADFEQDLMASNIARRLHMLAEIGAWGRRDLTESSTAVHAITGCESRRT